MAPEHNFLGTWEIFKCTFEGNDETWISGLEGIKFRLDENNDITFYNDSVSHSPDAQSKEKICANCDSASVLFSCETFDVNEENPRLIFGAFAGHSIEFNTRTLLPTDELILDCENWYTIHCKRLKNDHVVGQEKQFSLGDALKDTFFSDVLITSSDGIEYHCHSIILRLNGFDCSICCEQLESPILSENFNDDDEKSPKNIQIAITDLGEDDVKNEIDDKSTIIENKNLPTTLNLSPTFLQLPGAGSYDNMSLCKKNNLSTSFNCLNISTGKNNQIISGSNLNKYKTSSDSNLQSNYVNSRNIFNFSNDIYLNSSYENNSCCNRKPPLSPYKAKSLFPFDTPPNSPLTPVSVLNNLPSFMLAPIVNWIYTESLIANMNEDTCEKLINFAETQPSLIKLVEPCRKYLKLIRLKKVVIDIIMNIHSIINKIIQKITPSNVRTQPNLLFGTFKECLKDGAIGCVKILQFCNLFVKDISDISRNQKNEIIKYVRTRIPIFLQQVHQLLKNILEVLINLDDEKKAKLVTYLVPEIESSFKVITNVVEEVKNSLGKLCKDLKCSHLDLSMQKECKTNFNEENQALFSSNFNFANSDKNVVENDLKFVLYMYEVRKMRDVYGRISTMLEILKEKKTLFCEMNFLDKRSTINQNLEQLILEIPNYILIVENISDRFDEKLGWKEFKFCFKLATSQINGVITKLLDHKSALVNSLSQICNLVQKDEFIFSLSELGFLQKSNVIKNESGSEDKLKYDYKNIKLNLVKNLCESPITANSVLSKNALRLLHSGQLTDMEFEVRPSNGDTNGDSNSYISNKSLIFRAHRIIISTRCEWFKKALLSGMMESITRKIIIPDTSPVIFRRLLLYLYGAPIDKTVGAEQICELMLLADKYSVDDLKELCENSLNLLIDEYSVVCLLGIADRYGASVLKSKCLSFLSQHPKLTKLDIFDELPQQIQQEVKDLIHWQGRVPQPWSNVKRQSLKSPSRGKSRSRRASPSYM